VGVGDDLHLDVAPPADEALHENDRVAEGVRGFGLRTAEHGRQPVGRPYDPDAPATSAAPGLDHKRVADCVRMPGGILGAGHRPAAPRCHRDTVLLGQ